MVVDTCRGGGRIRDDRSTDSSDGHDGLQVGVVGVVVGVVVVVAGIVVVEVEVEVWVVDVEVGVVAGVGCMVFI